MNLRDYERESIRRFVQSAADEGYLSGSVLDVGSGTRPYATIVKEAGGEYVPFDAPGYPGAVPGVRDSTGDAWGRLFRTALCTQVIQYQEQPLTFLTGVRARLAHSDEAWLVMTYPTHWPEVEAEDLWRFTKTGMARLLTDAGFSIIRHEKRGSVWDPRFDVGAQKRVTAVGEEFVLGYGVVARA